MSSFDSKLPWDIKTFKTKAFFSDKTTGDKIEDEQKNLNEVEDLEDHEEEEAEEDDEDDDDDADDVDEDLLEDDYDYDYDHDEF